jgi:hypothetical protein
MLLRAAGGKEVPADFQIPAPRYEAMKVRYSWLALFVLLAVPLLRAQGPPYQTDDPVPVDLHHYEFYIFGAVDGTPAEIDSTGPAFASSCTPSSPGAASSPPTTRFICPVELGRAPLA